MPVVQGSALTLIYLTGGIVAIEYLFAYPGLGSALTTAVAGRDLPVVQAIVAVPRRSVYVIVELGGRPAHGIARPSTRGPGASETAEVLAETRGPVVGRRRLRTLRRSLRYGRVRVGITLLGLVVLLALIGPGWRPTTPTPSSAYPQAPRPDSSCSAPTTSATMCSPASCGEEEAFFGWPSPPPPFGVAVGAAVGLLAAYAGSIADDLLMRGMDVILAFPQIVFVLLFVSLLGPKLGLIVVLVAIAWVPQVARVVRGITSDIVQREYVESG